MGTGCTNGKVPVSKKKRDKRKRKKTDAQRITARLYGRRSSPAESSMDATLEFRGTCIFGQEKKK